MSPQYDEIRQQILNGQRSWSCPPQDADLFLATVVEPLREMKARGAFDVAEAKQNRRGKSVVVRVDIVGSINHVALGAARQSLES